MQVLLDVVNVQVLPNYHLYLEFENGEQRIFNMSPYMDQHPFELIKSQAIFNCASIDYGTVVWPGNIDIDPETLYDLSISQKM